MTNEYTQDITGTGMYVELPDQPEPKQLELFPELVDDPEPERYYDWMLWKMRQEDLKEKNFSDSA